MTGVLAPLILAHLVSLAAAPGPAKSALLPVRADMILLDDEAALMRLDAALRRGSAGLLDVDATNANVAAAKDAGVVCGGNDRACLSKLAALLDVERVLSAHAARTNGGFHVVIVAVDRAARVGSVEGDVGDAAGKDAKALVDRALTTALTAPDPHDAPPTPATTATRAHAATGDDDAPIGAPTIAGAALAATGVALVVGGAVTTTAMELAVQKPELFADRGAKLFAGQAGVVAVVVGAVAAGGGVAVLTLAR